MRRQASASKQSSASFVDFKKQRALQIGNDPSLRQFTALDGKAYHDVVPPDLKNLRDTSRRDIVSHLRAVLPLLQEQSSASGSGEAGPGSAHVADLVFGKVDNIPKTNLEDDALQEWFRKTAGMHTVQK